MSNVSGSAVSMSMTLNDLCRFLAARGMSWVPSCASSVRVFANTSDAAPGRQHHKAHLKLLVFFKFSKTKPAPEGVEVKGAGFALVSRRRPQPRGRLVGLDLVA